MEDNATKNSPTKHTQRVMNAPSTERSAFSASKVTVVAAAAAAAAAPSRRRGMTDL